MIKGIPYAIIKIYFTRVVQYSSQSVISEGGAKNPPKGISMKFLVLACGAQLRADAGS